MNVQAELTVGTQKDTYIVCRSTKYTTCNSWYPYKLTGEKYLIINTLVLFYIQPRQVHFAYNAAY